jgi:hypothetical protein
MLRKTLLLIASMLPLFANTAWADICFEYGSGGGISVAKGASLPAVNACTRVTLVDQGGRAGLATGSICTAEQGSGYPLLVLQYTYTACTGPGSYFESATCRIRLHDQGDLPREKDPGQVSSCNGVRRPTDGQHRPNGGVHRLFSESLELHQLSQRARSRPGGMFASWTLASLKVGDKACPSLRTAGRASGRLSLLIGAMSPLGRGRKMPRISLPNFHALPSWDTYFAQGPKIRTILRGPGAERMLRNSEERCDSCASPPG